MNAPLSCSMCGTPAIVALQLGASNALFYCPSCGTHWVYSSSDAHLSVNLYDDAYYANNYVPYKPAQAEFFRKQLDHLAQWIQPHRVLDVGFGTGVFLEECLRRGCEIHGIDSSTVARSQAARLLGNSSDLRLGDFAQGSWDEVAFDLISFWDVLAHLKDPRAQLRKASSLLAPGGVLVIKTPVRSRSFFKSLRFLPSLFDSLRRSLIHFPMQIYHFEPEGLSHLLGTMGYEILEYRIEAEPLDFPFKWSSLWFHPRGFLYFLIERVYNAVYPPIGCLIYARKK